MSGWMECDEQLSFLISPSTIFLMQPHQPLSKLIIAPLAMSDWWVVIHHLGRSRCAMEMSGAQCATVVGTTGTLVLCANS